MKHFDFSATQRISDLMSTTEAGTHKVPRPVPRWLLPVLLAAMTWPSWAFGAPDTLLVVAQVSNYNGFAVSCFGMKDGWIDLTVTGGQGPIEFKWSNGADSEDVGELAAGYYKVDVLDHSGQRVTLEFTLEQPLAMKLDVDVYEYTNGYNISCYECYNGNASVVVLGGAPPFTIAWSDGPVGAERYNLGPKDYKITASDANGCLGASATILLRGPERSDWSMTGNSNTTPGPQYIGTADGKDVVFKSNGQERMRLRADGHITLTDTTLFGKNLYVRGDGVIDAITDHPENPGPADPCATNPVGPGMDAHWRIGGNVFQYPLCLTNFPQIGTKVPLNFGFITDDQVRMVINSTGKVGIGTGQPMAKLHIDGDLLVRAKEGVYGDITSSADSLTGVAIWARNTHAAWGLSIDSAGNGHIMGDWNQPHPIMTFTYNKVGIGTVPPSNSNYQLFVEGGISTRDVMVKVGAWPDFVFDPDYPLLPLPELRAFLQSRHHLPGVPSAAELEGKGGIELGDMQTRLLRLVEEQALYILHLEERQADMEYRIRALEGQQR